MSAPSAGRRPIFARSDRRLAAVARDRDDCHPVFSSRSRRHTSSACPQQANLRIVQHVLLVSHRTRRDAPKPSPNPLAGTHHPIRLYDPAERAGSDAPYRDTATEPTNTLGLSLVHPPKLAFRAGALCPQVLEQLTGYLPIRFLQRELCQGPRHDPCWRCAACRRFFRCMRAFLLVVLPCQ